jgi:hypothetical protein
MKAIIRKIALYLVPALVIPASAVASNVGTGLIYQPAYLGRASEPGRIPLAPVIFNANYGYGSHSAIFQSRPCYHGYFYHGYLSDHGAPGYEQNLAVLYGISADISDPTQLQGSTLTLHLGKCQPPSTAPYTQEQVLAASLQCVLNTCGDLRKNAPLRVVIEGQGIPTPEWASKYAKAYHADETTDKDARVRIVLPGLKVEETPLGACYIVFESVPRDPRITRREPVFVPFLPEGEADAETVSLIPVWHGDEWNEPLNVLALPYMPYYEKWHSGVTGINSETVAIAHLTPPNPVCRRGSCDVRRSDKGVQIKFSDRDLRPYDMAVMIFACVASERPTLDKPMTVVIPLDAFSAEYRSLLKVDPSWKDGVSCEFVIDPAGLKLLKGSVPGYELKMEYGSLVIKRQAQDIPPTDGK